VAKKPKKKPPPICKAILLCDHVIVDALTKKLSIIGIFEAFAIVSTPPTTAPFTAFLQMTDGVGRYGVTIEIHDLQTGKILGRTREVQIEFPQRQTKLNFFSPVPPLPLPTPHVGRYDFVVFADGQEIDRQQFEVRDAGVPPDADDNPEPE
jgi:hypothetical protein